MAKPLFEVQIVGARDIQGRFQRASNELKAAQRDEMRDMGRTIVRVLQEEAPVRTGRLRRGIRFRTYQRLKDTELRITSEAPYTELVIRGRGPVVAKRAKALRFEPGPPGSGFIFRKRVGPAKANPFQKRAFAKLQDEPMRAARRIAGRIERAYSGM